MRPNTWEFLRDPMIAPSGFREYDARWRTPEEINLPGVTALGLGLGTQVHAHGLRPRVAVGNDYRDYALAIKQALVLGLIQAGCEVLDIGPAITPMAYFAQIHLGCPAVAMVTASHNPNGWTGVKMGLGAPLTHGPEEMAELRGIVLGGRGVPRPGGSWRLVPGVREAYLDDLAAGPPLARPLRIVCATGSGGAGAFAPELLARLGAEVIPLHTELDYRFPRYNPNPEAMEMLRDMAAAVRASGADLALGLDGDGDRCGVVDDAGSEIFADVVGVLIARDLAARHPGATVVADVKSTGLFASDPVLGAAGIRADYWKTGHSHMKRRVHALGALAGFEKSGHYFLAPPIGRGYDDGVLAAAEIARMVARADRPLSALRRELPPVWNTPTLSPACPDGEKYAACARIVARLEAMAAAGEPLGGRRIERVVTTGGGRAQLEGGAWALVRASSNTPNLVVVCESPEGEAHLRAVFEGLDALVRAEPSVGAYDQTF